MAESGAFQFSSPSKFSDWASYAGFDRTTGQFEGIADSAPAAAPVAPPASLQNKISAVIPAAMQMMQGNIPQAMNTLKNPTASQSVNKTLAPVSNYDYTIGLE